MGSKKIIYLIILILYFVNSYSKVLYNKNNLVITEIDIETYINLYENSYGYNLSNDSALRDLVLIKNLIENLEKNNQKFIDQIDNEIFQQYGEISKKSQSFLEFARFSKIREEFIKEYFQNKLKLEELKKLFSGLNSLDLPISKNNCLIIEKIIDLKDNEDFVKSFFSNLRNNTRDISILDQGIEYSVCINEKIFWDIEQLVIKYIQTKTNDEFQAFVYGKSKN